MVTIEIDGKPYQAKNGQMLIEVADANGITIPRFCYHKKLSVSANCRMCLVEVEKAPKLMPACATTVMNGMKVSTRSTKVLAAQKSVMEFLLINHPLDCPICDQGGECELQDLAVGYGKDLSAYQEGKRAVFSKNLGPLIATDMTRCIHCTRCVRFSQEISGLQEMGAPGRGEHIQIGTYVEKNIVSELSGNMVDICPVGALTSKPSRFSARAWEMQQHESVAPHDALGSNLYIHTRRNQVMRVAPRENEAVNEVWISDRDRFSYEGLTAEDRLTTPMIKKDGKWQETNWEAALEFAVDGLKAVIKEQGSQSVGALSSPTATTEELYLLQKLMRGIGSQNIDHRLRQTDFSDQTNAPLFPYLGQPIANIENCDTICIIGSNLRKELPLLNHRVRKAVSQNKAKVIVVNSIDYEFNYPIQHKLIAAPTNIVNHLAGIAKSLLETNQTALLPEKAKALLNNVSPTEEQQSIAQSLSNSQKGSVLLGQLATIHSQFSTIRTLTAIIAKLSGANLGYVGEANSAGACLAGMLPHRLAGGQVAEKAGLDAQAMLTQALKAYVLLGLEPELDSQTGEIALNTLKQADFVIVLTAYHTSAIQDYADVVLPIALFAETSGTYINNEGSWQSFNGAITPPDETRPAWKILRVLGNLFDVDGFDYMDSTQVRDELKQQIGAQITNNKGAWQIPTSLNVEAVTAQDLSCIYEIPMYASDPLVRRANSLQQTVDAQIAKGIHINQKLANKFNLEQDTPVHLKQGNVKFTLAAVIDDRVPEQHVLIYGGQTASMQLNPSQAIELNIVA